jgi:DNA-binding MarR family transcriptional regulator
MPMKQQEKLELEAPVATEHYWFAYRIARLSNRIERSVTAVHSTRHHLTLVCWRVLANIARYQPLSQKELGGYTATDPPKVTRAVALLVAQKLITDVKDETDRRRSVLRLTRKGREVFEEVAKIIGKAESVLFADLKPAERKQLRSWIERMEQKFDGGPLAKAWRDL